jgi:hypothetical protein
MNASRFLISHSQIAAKRLLLKRPVVGSAMQTLNRQFSAPAVASTACNDNLVKEAVKRMMLERDNILDEEFTKPIEDEELQRRFRQFQVRKER